MLRSDGLGRGGWSPELDVHDGVELLSDGPLDSSKLVWVGPGRSLGFGFTQ